MRTSGGDSRLVRYSMPSRSPGPAARVAGRATAFAVTRPAGLAAAISPETDTGIRLRTDIPARARALPSGHVDLARGEPGRAAGRRPAMVRATGRLASPPRGARLARRAHRGT